MLSSVVAVGCDHAASDLTKAIIAALGDKQLPVFDLGTHGSDAVDYPDVADRMASALQNSEAGCGVLLCATGIGISIAANRYRHVRAALVHDTYEARACRAHNDANVLVLGGQTMGVGLALACLDVFLSTPFDGGRHERRVKKVS